MKCNTSLLISIFALFAVTFAHAAPLDEALKQGPVEATTVEGVTIRDSEPEKKNLVIETGKELFEVSAKTPVKITAKKDIDTLFGRVTYVQVAVKDPRTGAPTTGWAYFSDPNKTQFKVLAQPKK